MDLIICHSRPDKEETKDHVPGMAASACRAAYRLGAKPSPPSPFAMLGKDVWVAGVPAVPSDVDDFLTDAGYFLMILGHQSRYDLF